MVFLTCFIDSLSFHTILADFLLLYENAAATVRLSLCTARVVYFFFSYEITRLPRQNSVFWPRRRFLSQLRQTMRPSGT